jgi:tetratricopeptide (TPR) repeat protein
MIRKSLFAIFLAATLVLTAFAQTAPIRGVVEMTQADGKKVPVAGATVEVYRTDIKGKFPSAKTDKKGVFVFAGLPFGAEMTLSISGPGIAPTTLPKVKAGREDITISVVAGDGKKFTEDEVRSGGGGGGSTVATTGMSAEDKKKFDENEKKIAAVKASNAKIEESNKIILRVFNEGQEAVKANNSDLAIAKFNEGLAADPEFEHPGTPAMLNSKSNAIRRRGVDRYNAAIKAGGGGMEDAKQDLSDAASTAKMSIDLLKKNTPPTEADSLKNYNEYKYTARTLYTEAMRLVTKIVDQSRVAELISAYDEYFAIETDPAKKLKAQGVFAQALMDASDFERAITEFEKVLAVDPADTNALSGAGLCLVNLGYVNNDKVKFQNGANYLARYIELAPDTDRYKADAKGLLETLKKEQNVTAQKPAKVTPPKKKP